jgi:hypothetical protein
LGCSGTEDSIDDDSANEPSAKRKNIKKWSKSTTAAGKKAKTATEHLPPLNRNRKSVLDDLDDLIELWNRAMEVRHDKEKARSQKYEVQKL